MKSKLKEIIAIEERSGQSYIRIQGGANFYRAFTIPLWIERRRAAGYSVSNPEYVRSCCRRQVDSRGQENKLPDGYDAAKYKNRIYIYELNPTNSVSSEPEDKSMPYQKVLLDSWLNKILRSFKYQAIVNKSPIKVEIIFSPDGSTEWRPVSGTEANFSVGNLLFNTAWLVYIANACYSTVNIDAVIEKYCKSFLSLPADAELLIDFNKRCLWCADYKERHSKQNTRFHQSHKAKFFAWKKRVANEYKRHKLTPKIAFQSEGVSALLDHPVIIDALHHRTTEIYGSIAKFKN